MQICLLREPTLHTPRAPDKRHQKRVDVVNTVVQALSKISGDLALRCASVPEPKQPRRAGSKGFVEGSLFGFGTNPHCQPALQIGLAVGGPETLGFRRTVALTQPSEALKSKGQGFRHISDLAGVVFPLASRRKAPR